MGIERGNIAYVDAVVAGDICDKQCIAGELVVLCDIVVEFGDVAYVD